MNKIPLLLVSIGIIALLLLVTLNFKQQSFNIQPTTVTCSLSESNPTCTINIFAHDPVTITGSNFPPNSNIEFTGTICGVNYTITTSSDSSGSINAQRTRFITTALYQLCSNFNGATTFSLSYSGLTINGTLYEPIVNVNGFITHVLTQGQSISAPVYATAYSTTSEYLTTHYVTDAMTTAIQVSAGNNNVQVKAYSTRNIYHVETATENKYISGNCGNVTNFNLLQTQQITTIFYTKGIPSMLCLNPCDYDTQMYVAIYGTTATLFGFNGQPIKVKQYEPATSTTELPQPIVLNIGNLVTTAINFYSTNKKMNTICGYGGTTFSQIYIITTTLAPPPPSGQQYVTLKIQVQGQT